MSNALCFEFDEALLGFSSPKFRSNCVMSVNCYFSTNYLVVGSQPGTMVVIGHGGGSACY